ncbi:nucleoside recognition domain-containing protein [Syntrophomonas erecta]
MALGPAFIEAITGSINSVLQIAVIVIPLMISIEIFQDLHLLDRLTSVITPLTRLVGMSGESRLPLLAGLIFGISYGSGIIINSARQGKLTYRDIYLVNLFLVVCHSLVEDTVLFAAIGARWIPILIFRFIVATILCYILSRSVTWDDAVPMIATEAVSK